MRTDWTGYSFTEYEGYGRYSTRLIRALRRLGADVRPYLSEVARAPEWMKQEWGIQPGTLTISCLPPVHLQDAPSGGRHWLLTMTEGSELPDGVVDGVKVAPSWAEIIHKRNIERVIVPCEYNAEAFRRGGVTCPIHVIPGGTCPTEFPLRDVSRETSRPYTFLALGDRGARKGWCEVYRAFFQAFGGPQDTPDVRLIIKSRPHVNDLLDAISEAYGLDPRITIMQEDIPDMRDVYALADCMAIPSRSEGWGMVMREAAMTGLPVITQRYSGMDDGHTDEWAFPVYNGTLERIPAAFEHIKGEWMKADVGEVAGTMRWCYDKPDNARYFGSKSAEWLRANQTWEISAQKLLDLIQEYS